jgi:diguanylate cyclase (GGDEF)-like protein
MRTGTDEPSSGTDASSWSVPAALPHGRGRTIRVLAIIAAMLAVAALVGPPLQTTDALMAHLALPWWAIVLAFAATETFVLNIQVRRETQTISFSEIPLVLGLFLAAPLALLVGRILAAAAVMVAYRRSPPLKIGFNLALATAETSVAVAIFRAMTAGEHGAAPITWVAAYVAALTADALGAFAIGAVIAVYEGAMRLTQILREAASQQVPAMGVTIALLAVTSLTVSPASVWLLVGFGVMLLLAFRTYASLAERHLSLERLYRFSQAVSSAPEIDQVMGNVLAEARELLRSERATAIFVASEGELIARIALGASGQLTRSEDPPDDMDAWLVDQVIGGRAPQLLPRTTRDAAARRWLDAKGVRDAVAVPLRGGAGIVGILVVADRLGDVYSFEQDDVLMLETVANHAGVALRNRELVGRLRYDALHDALTGLPNRTHLQRGLAAALDEVAAGRVPGAAVMILDLDEFKEVNDTLGHEHGDMLLVEVGARLTSAVGQAGIVARLGGDEFAVLLPSTGEENRALQIGRRMLRSLEQPIALDGLEVEVGASVGIALAPAHATDPAALLKRADLAMYDAKTTTRGVRLYEPELDISSPRRLQLVSELRTALQDGSIQVHVQPQATLRTGDVVGVEALVRWEHPELGRIAPDEFIPVAERSGLIGPLTTRVLELSLAACASWRAAGLDLGIAVNLSTRSLHDADLVDEVARALRRHGVPADRLTLEVTEGSVMADPTRAIALLHQLRDLGVRLSVDDFGTGYSSLSYLQRLPVQEVKIDRSFIAALSQEQENVAIVRAIIDLGRHLGLEVVAEGVEDAATSELLTSMNCDLVQGWHLARPMPTEELPGWLRTRSKSAGSGGLRVV